MTKVLLTAFEPYGDWLDNSSWLALLEVTRDLPPQPAITTRKYPVDFEGARRQLQQDLEAGFDFALHVGQAPQSSCVVLETTAINVWQHPNWSGDRFERICADGPVAYSTSVPVSLWSEQIRATGIPAAVSHHAGTFLCNAVYYWSQQRTRAQGSSCQSLFVHLPLASSQVANDGQPHPSLPSDMAASALRTIISGMDELGQAVA